jgi:broad specificity phosphatase PhoE
LKQVWLIRHGETEWNQEHRIQGWTDIPLNENGRQQAESLARHLEGMSIERIIVSDLKRAAKTASILQQTLGCPLSTDQRLRERKLGPSEGMFRAEVRDSFLMDIEGAEPLPEFHARIRRLLDDLGRANFDLPVMCVTHGGWIRNALQLLGLEKIPLIQNTSFTTLEWAGDTWRVGNVGQIPHMQSTERGNQSNQRRQA